MKIRITKGATRIDNVIKTSADGVFSVDGAVGAHLIARGVAEAVAAPADSYDAEAPCTIPIGETRQSSGQDGDGIVGDKLVGDGEGESDDITSRPEYNADMKQQELRDIGAVYGIEFPAVCAKTEMVKALDEYFDSHDASSEMEGGDLDLTPQMPE